jgi:hypothetical protein
VAAFARLAAADARRVPWRNGRGVTEEVAVWPAGTSFEAGDFDGRVARAAVVEDGPFSRFDGFDRVVVVVEGAGLLLTHADAASPVLVAPLAPHRFRGEDATSARLVDGPVRDLSVLARRARCRADARVVALSACPAAVVLPAGHALVHVLAGRVVARAVGEVWTLDPGDSLRGTDLAAPLEATLEGGPGATVVVVELAPVAAPPAP